MPTSKSLAINNEGQFVCLHKLLRLASLYTTALSTVYAALYNVVINRQKMAHTTRYDKGMPYGMGKLHFFSHIK
jgi:hypothetical protein